MPTNNYILTPDWNFISADELIYSRNIRYIDLDTDEMMHWKYIKRVKLSNGKYRYYYDEKDNHLTELKKDWPTKRMDTKINIANLAINMYTMLMESITKENTITIKKRPERIFFCGELILKDIVRRVKDE